VTIQYKELEMDFRIFASLFIFLFSATISFAIDEEHAKLHEFNTKVPSSFTGTMISMTTPDAGAFKVYTSGPAASKSAILLIHEWWGLNAHIKGIADQFGKIGYRAYAVDLYGGQVATDPQTATKYMKAVDPIKALAKLKFALNEINKSHSSVGSIGWCFGGGWSLQASLAEPSIVDATVIYYGQLESDSKVLGKLKSPVLGVFAQKDGWITPAMVNDFEKGLNKAGVKNEIKSYDADHAFANPSGKRFMLDPARDAWDTTLRFFKENLGK
jgi:carboxymethylenebutenolidase